MLASAYGAASAPTLGWAAWWIASQTGLRAGLVGGIVAAAAIAFWFAACLRCRLAMSGDCVVVVNPLGTDTFSLTEWDGRIAAYTLFPGVDAAVLPSQGNRERVVRAMAASPTEAERWLWEHAAGADR